MVAANSRPPDAPHAAHDPRRSRLHPAIRERVATLNADIVHNVQAAAGSNAVLVVGMAGNPTWPPRRKALEAAGVPSTTSSTAATSANGGGATR
jgi:hypothetical protein